MVRSWPRGSEGAGPRPRRPLPRFHCDRRLLAAIHALGNCHPSRTRRSCSTAWAQSDSDHGFLAAHMLLGPPLDLQAQHAGHLHLPHQRAGARRGVGPGRRKSSGHRGKSSSSPGTRPGSTITRSAVTTLVPAHHTVHARRRVRRRHRERSPVKGTMQASVGV